MLKNRVLLLSSNYAVEKIGKTCKINFPDVAIGMTDTRLPIGLAKRHLGRYSARRLEQKRF